ncbi:MAG TPA: zinc ABC transporter substrate-binding protein [Thermodesulfovibrionales bacterium]|nr:zinc ABC transporter substrate-binding protein [Thermodesulfovibrionales bacterium]
MKTKSSVKIVASLMCTILFWASLSSCKPSGKSATPPAKGGNRIKVVTTLFPLYDMAKHIGADKAEVSLLLPPGVEPHSFEPKPGDILKINEAAIFVYTGKFMEPWAVGIIKGVANKNLVVVDASEGAKMIAGVFHDKDEPVGLPDPHIWLDFDNGRIMARNIARAFQTGDSAHSDFYEKNADEYDRKLTELDTSYRNTLLTCKKKEIIYAGHYAFGYLANRYGLKYTAAQGVSPDAEPTAKDLVKLINQIKKNNIRYVFYEELTSPKIAETLADETGAKMLLLNAAHNLTKDQLEQGVSFFDVLSRDLDNLKIGLECK